MGVFLSGEILFESGLEKDPSVMEEDWTSAGRRKVFVLLNGLLWICVSSVDLSVDPTVVLRLIVVFVGSA